LPGGIVVSGDNGVVNLLPTLSSVDTEINVQNSVITDGRLSGLLSATDLSTLSGAIQLKTLNGITSVAPIQTVRTPDVLELRDLPSVTSLSLLSGVQSVGTTLIISQTGVDAGEVAAFAAARCSGACTFLGP
jgi:hypothetical protein